MKNASKIVQKLRGFSKYRDWSGLQAYLVSEAYILALMALPPRERLKVPKAVMAAQLACRSRAPKEAPPRLSMRVRWTPERIAELQRLARRHGGDVRGIERIAGTMGIPFENARRAYHRYVKEAYATAA